MSTVCQRERHKHWNKQHDIAIMEGSDQNVTSTSSNLQLSSTNKRVKLSGSERNKRWREKKGSEFKKGENDRVEKIRKKRVAQMSSTEKTKYKMAACERKRKSRLMKKMKEMENTNDSPNETVSSPCTSDNPSPSHQPYSRPQSLGKAIKRSIRALPHSPRKRHAVVSGLAKRFGVESDNTRTSHSTNGLTEEAQNAVQAFYFQSDISYTMPGLKDEMTVWLDGKKERLRKYYLTMFLREAYWLFQEVYEVNIGFSTFCRLRPKNVLLLKNTPKDQCKCKTHENFQMKLKALDSGIMRDKDCWKTILCDSSNLQSSCWLGKCDRCKGGKLLQATLADQVDCAKETQWHHWENDEKQILKKVTKTGCYGELLELTLECLPVVQEHTRVKRIQSNSFESLKESSRILQIDFAMAYSCEYQNEVQAALWSRASVTLFTAAVFHKNITRTYLICSDTKEKGKDTVRIFINKLYHHIVDDVPVADDIDDVIFSDGPSAEFKNKFCMKILYDLSQKLKKDVSWKYFATSHGKGVVDGIGGRAKSLVRQKSLSKDEGHVVQSSKDFANLATKLMTRTTIIHISQEDIDSAGSLLSSWENVPAATGIRSVHDALCRHEQHRIELRHVTGQLEPDSVVVYEGGNKESPVPANVTCTTQVPDNFVVGDWVAVIYDEQWWPGTVESILDNQVSVSFMKPVSKNKFIWRQDKNGGCLDRDTVPACEVLAKMHEVPVPVSNRHFSVSEECARYLNNLMKNIY